MADTDLELYEGDEELVEFHRPDNTERIAQVSAEIAELRAEAAGMISSDEPDGQSTDLVPAQQTPERIKTRMAVKRAQLKRVEKELRGKREELECLMREQMAVAAELLAPLEKAVAKLQEGIWTVNLYLGRDEQILQLADGEPAPLGTPISVRQLVLAMDEESALNPEDQGIDASNIAEFDEWLLADPKNLDQVLPEVKGVVALVPRFSGKKYDDPWKENALAKANQQTYFLIRNGDKLYRTWTDFNTGRYLVPTADEFNEAFVTEQWSPKLKEKVKVPLVPGSPKWKDAEERADAKQRHYMRVALILQGLIDRTTVFHPLPPSGVSMTDTQSYKDGKVIFITDAENLLTTSRKPFDEWLKELNAQVRVGMRVILASNAYSFSSASYTNQERGYRREHSRITPPHIPWPDSLVLHTIEKQEGRTFVIYYERTDEIWDSFARTYVKPQKRARCELYASDNFWLPFDLVTVEEMEAYLHARLDRHAYIRMFPVLKTAIALKKQEKIDEEPFRQMLIGVLARDCKSSTADAEAAVDELIKWYKLSNKFHRALIGDEKQQASAVRTIVAEYSRRLRDNTGPNPEIVSRLRVRHPNCIWIGRKKSGRYVVLLPENDSNVWVSKVEYNAVGKYVGAENWKLISKPWIGKLFEGYRTERFDTWDLDAALADHLSDPEKLTLLEEVKRSKLRVHRYRHDEKDPEEIEPKQLAVFFDGRGFRVWFLKGHAQLSSDKLLTAGPKDVNIDERKYEWRRATRAQLAVLEGQGWSRGEIDLSRTEDAEKGELLWQDVDALAEARKQHQAFLELEKEQRRLRVIVQNAISSIKNSWLKEREAEAYKRFLEDFVDPDLWEGHRKTLSIRYPHEHHKSWHYRDESDDVYGSLELLIERGEDVSGLTVKEIVEKAGKDSSTVPPDIQDIKVFPNSASDEDEDDE